VRRFPQRVKCAMLAWRALEQALSSSPDRDVTTEDTDAL
jgi:NifU-like protein involved in Fe-S cluster formation